MKLVRRLHPMIKLASIRRLLSRVDADRLDVALGGFIARRSAGAASSGRRRVLAVDGKTVRGLRHVDDAGVEIAGRHLLAVINKHTRVVLGQIGVNGKSTCRIESS